MEQTDKFVRELRIVCPVLRRCFVPEEVFANISAGRSHFLNILFMRASYNSPLTVISSKFTRHNLCICTKVEMDLTEKLDKIK